MAVEACVDASAEPVEAEADIVVTIVDPETAVQDVCDALEAAEQDKPSHIVLDLETVLDRAQFGQLVLAVQQEYDCAIRELRGAPEVVSAVLLSAYQKPAPASAQDEPNRESDKGSATPRQVLRRLNGARRTSQVHGTLRSGRVVRFDGDVVLIGDVNPGAKIIATGDVLILGKLKGPFMRGPQAIRAHLCLRLGTPNRSGASESTRRATTKRAVRASPRSQSSRTIH